MAAIIFVTHSGEKHPVDLEEGKSLMQVALDNGIPGIDADCGGECACGTCHVIVDQYWFDQTGDAGDDEAQMLELTPEKSETSRLSCQVVLTNAMDGMVVHLPEFQM